jgi:hypothetical protein
VGQPSTSSPEAVKAPSGWWRRRRPPARLGPAQGGARPRAGRRRHRPARVSACARQRRRPAGRAGGGRAAGSAAGAGQRPRRSAGSASTSWSRAELWRSASRLTSITGSSSHSGRASQASRKPGASQRAAVRRASAGPAHRGRRATRPDAGAGDHAAGQVSPSAGHDPSCQRTKDPMRRIEVTTADTMPIGGQLTDSAWLFHPRGAIVRSGWLDSSPW